MERFSSDCDCDGSPERKPANWVGIRFRCCRCRCDPVKWMKGKAKYEAGTSTGNYLWQMETFVISSTESWSVCKPKWFTAPAHRFSPVQFPSAVQPLTILTDALRTENDCLCDKVRGWGLIISCHFSAPLFLFSYFGCCVSHTIESILPLIPYPH